MPNKINNNILVSQVTEESATLANHTKNELEMFFMTKHTLRRLARASK